MTTTVQQRLTALESRVSDIENGYGQSIYRLERRVVRADLLLAAIAEHLGVPAPTDADVDAVLDEQ